MLETPAQALSDEGWNGMLYRAQPPLSRPARLRAVPYCAWDNREPGDMAVWLRRA
jgi:uncharacterized protein